MRSKKFLVVAVFAATAMACFPDTSEARGGRGCWGGGRGLFGGGFGGRGHHHGGGGCGGYYGGGCVGGYGGNYHGHDAVGMQTSGTHNPCCCVEGGSVSQPTVYGAYPGMQHGQGGQYGQPAPMPQGNPPNTNFGTNQPYSPTPPGTGGQPQSPQNNPQTQQDVPQPLQNNPQTDQNIPQPPQPNPPANPQPR